MIHYRLRCIPSPGMNRSPGASWPKLSSVLGARRTWRLMPAKPTLSHPALSYQAGHSDRHPPSALSRQHHRTRSWSHPRLI